MLVPVILSGGAGTRLWPLSRELYPKQLLPLMGEYTMLQDTVRRLTGLDATAPVVVCNDAHRFLVAEQRRLIGISPRAIVLEPFGRNTAPAIALAALAAVKSAVKGEDPILLVLPADHVIRDVAAFQVAAVTAMESAKEGRLVTFGVVPHTPETGYGYIRRGESLGAVQRIAQFIEKPDLTRAQAFLASGDHYWNRGMFVVRARRYLEELEKFAPEMAKACRESFDSSQSDLDFTRVDAKRFESCPSDSIDYAVMEKTADAVVVPLDAGWRDVGSWASLHAASASDADGNFARGDVFL